MSDKSKPVIYWLRSDLRLDDNPALSAALASGQTVIPVYILDDKTPGIWKRGAASRWWLHHSLAALDTSVQKNNLHRIVYATGDAQAALTAIIAQTGATDVYWNRCYEPWAISRDIGIKETLKKNGIGVHSASGYLLFEPWEIKNKSGQPYQVFTPFSKACFEKADTFLPPADFVKPAKKNASRISYQDLSLDDLALLPNIPWYKTMEKIWQPGEEGAHKRLQDFLSKGVAHYKTARDFPAQEDGVSGLSPHLHFGEISPRRVWFAVLASLRAGREDKNLSSNAYGWLRQLIWREFSYHLLYAAPDFPEQPWNKKFKDFPWKKDPVLIKQWQQGNTGYPIIDAGMRQLWQTGWMHNRVRMIVGSFLVKNLLQPWREGEDWFWDTLVDADLANNAAGWQWIAGCGADAAPYFRVFNPVLQSKKFDPQGAYIRKFVPELAAIPDAYIHTPWDAPPLIRQQAKDYPAPIVDIAASRNKALKAYHDIKSNATA